MVFYDEGKHTHNTSIWCLLSFFLQVKYVYLSYLTWKSHITSYTYNGTLVTAYRRYRGRTTRFLHIFFIYNILQLPYKLGEICYLVNHF